MDLFIGIGLFTGGMIFGVVIFAIINQMREKQSQAANTEMIEQLKQSFNELSRQALRMNSSDFLTLANESLSKQTQVGEKNLDQKKELIDKTLQNVREELEKMKNQISENEKNRHQQFGALDSSIRATIETAKQLGNTTAQLTAALSNTKSRGQWGERMAEDILGYSGMIEGVNYFKQRTGTETRSRPDYTFVLPNDMKLNMDVKFPLNNYMRYLEANTDNERESHKKLFLTDVRKCVDSVTTRDYINPADRTLDYVLVFIPNEQILAFIFENDKTLIEDALKKKVVLCSPLTLYSTLAVIRQAMDNFRLEQTTGQIMKLFGDFQKQWTEFVKSLTTIGKRIEEARTEYDKLTSTRRNQLERPLRQILSLQKQSGNVENTLLEGELIDENTNNES